MTQPSGGGVLEQFFLRITRASFGAVLSAFLRSRPGCPLGDYARNAVKREGSIPKSAENRQHAKAGRKQITWLWDRGFSHLNSCVVAEPDPGAVNRNLTDDVRARVQEKPSVLDIRDGHQSLVRRRSVVLGVFKESGHDLNERWRGVVVDHIQRCSQVRSEGNEAANGTKHEIVEPIRERQSECLRAIRTIKDQRV